MKKTLFFLILFIMAFSVGNVYAIDDITCNTYNIQLKIIGEGAVKYKNIQYDTDAKFTINCNDNDMNLVILPSEGYKIETLVNNENVVNLLEKNNNFYYDLSLTNEDTTLVVTFTKLAFEEEKTPNALFVPIYLDSNTVFDINVGDILFTFNNEFVKNNSNLKIDLSATEVEENLLLEAQKGVLENAIYYDFSLLLNGEKKEKFDGEVLVKIPYKSEKSIRVYYLNDLGELEDYEVTQEDNYVTFKTNHFSVFAIVEENNMEDLLLSNTEPPKEQPMISIIVEIILLIGIIVLLLLKKEKMNKKD